jgi:hypothetical protein
VVRDASRSELLPAFVQRNDSALHPVHRVRRLGHPNSLGGANKDVHQVRQIAADASAVPAVGHQFVDPSPERFPERGHDCLPSASVAKAFVGVAKCPLKYPALPQLAAHLAVALQPADDSPGRPRLEAAEQSVVPEAPQSAEVLRQAAAHPEPLAQWKPPDAEVHSVLASERQALPALLQELVSRLVRASQQRVPRLRVLVPEEPLLQDLARVRVPLVSLQPAPVLQALEPPPQEELPQALELLASEPAAKPPLSQSARLPRPLLPFPRRLSAAREPFPPLPRSRNWSVFSFPLRQNPAIGQ